MRHGRVLVPFQVYHCWGLIPMSVNCMPVRMELDCCSQNHRLVTFSLSLSHFLSLGQTHTHYFSYCLQSHTHIHFTRAIAIWPCNSNYGFLTFSYYHTSLSVKVATPPYVSDVVSEAQLVEQLTTLVASYPLIRRWVFKLPRHTRGRGFGQFNMFVNNLFTSKHLCT